MLNSMERYLKILNSMENQPQNAEFLKSQLQNAEFRNSPEDFQPRCTISTIVLGISPKHSFAVNTCSSFIVCKGRPVDK